MSVEAFDSVSGEVVETISADEARRLTTEAKTEFKSASDHFGKAWSLIEEAVQGGGHLALGYRSPGDYLHAEFDGVLSGLDVAQRRVAVRSMSSWGLSTRAIAKPLGVDNKTVHRDLNSGVASATPEPETQATPGFVPGWRPAQQPRPPRSAEKLGLSDDGTDDSMSWVREPAPETSAVEPHVFTRLPDPGPQPEPERVTGIDGKQYSRPQRPQQPRRRPLGDGFRDASLDLGKVITRIQNLVADDRFPNNKNEVARYANDLIRARDALQRAIDQMS